MEPCPECYKVKHQVGNVGTVCQFEGFRKVRRISASLTEPFRFEAVEKLDSSSKLTRSENFGLGPKLIDNFGNMENDSKKDPRKRRNTINIRPADSKKDQRKRRKTTNFQPVSKASFRFKMDHVTQCQTDVNFYSEKKCVKNLPWKVKLQPNIYGVEGKDFYFLECFLG